MLELTTILTYYVYTYAPSQVTMVAQIEHHSVDMGL